MADYNIKAEITADASGFESGVKKAEKASKSLSKSVSGVIQGLGKNGLVGALGAVGLASSGLSATLGSVVKIARKVSETMAELTNAYKTQLIAERQLDTAIQNNPFVTGASADALKQFASEMQKVSNYGDEELLPMMANLVSLGRTEAETMQIMEVALDMSASGSMSLDTAITQLNATLNGNIGRLGQQNAELKGLTEEELKSGKAVEILGEKFKGLSSATADTSKQLQNIKGDFKEALGQFTLPSSDTWNKFWSGFYERGITVINNLNKYIDANTIGKKLSSVLETQLKPLKDYGQKGIYLRDALSVITDEELGSLEAYLKGLSSLNENQKVLLDRVEKESIRRKEVAEIEDAMAKKKADRLKAQQEEADRENVIIKLKEEHLKKIAEQEAKWENIKRVTGEEVSLEEKLKFYQEDLISIMTESGGKITENNSYYIEQKKIIDKILKAILDVKKETEAVGELNFFGGIKDGWKNAVEDMISNTRSWATFFKDSIKTVTNAFNNLFIDLGESFVDGAKGAKYYTGVVLEGLAEILKALGAELSARTAIALLSKQYADATKGAIASATALMASGVVSAVAKNLKETSETIENTSEVLKDFNKNTEITIEKLHELKDALAGVISGSTGHVSEFITTMTSYKSIAKGLKENIDALQEPLQQAKVQMEAVRDLGLKAKAEYDQMGGLKKAIQGIPLAMQIETYNVALAKYDSLLKEVEDAQKQYEEALRQIDEYLDNSVEKLKANNDALQESIDSYREFFAMASESNKYMQVLVEEQRESIKNSVLGTYNELTKTGEKIGSSIFDSIKKGATKTDFLSAMKEYVKENLLKLAVYTDSFSDKLAKIGAKLSKAISGQGSVKELRREMELLYEEASQSATKAEKIISEAFGDIADSVNSGVSSVENGLTRLGKAIQNFKETVSDVGNDIASELINGLSEGLTQGDFLSNMKKWLKKMLVQATVYTESMKAEIEAIGKAITKGITEGFSETSLHEIKRDLSWVFENANNTISNIDRILDNTFSGYASGTNNASSGLHLVGEAGPELIRFRGGEKVYNNQQTNKILGNGTGSTFNVTFNNLQDTSAYVMMNQLKQYNRQMAINGIV